MSPVVASSLACSGILRVFLVFYRTANSKRKNKSCLQFQTHFPWTQTIIQCSASHKPNTASLVVSCVSSEDSPNTFHGEQKGDEALKQQLNCTVQGSSEAAGRGRGCLGVSSLWGLRGDVQPLL